MPYITPLTTEAAAPAVAATLNAVKAKLGMVPNIFATMAQAPAVLNGYLGFSEALAGGRLTARQREIVALAVGQANTCQYCLSAHTLLGKGSGLSESEIALARAGKAANTLDAAIASFAVRLTEQRGRLSPSDRAALRQAGLDDGLMLEVIAAVALNTLTNYTNHVAETVVDFPPVAV